MTNGKQHFRFEKIVLKEKGRSMTEMLAVLAIIGVLSISGLIGYREALMTYRADEIIDEMNKYAVLISQQYLTNNEDLNFDELPERTKNGYALTAVEDPEGFFELSVYQIERRVCEKILESGWMLPSAVYVNMALYENDSAICSTDAYVERMDFDFAYDLAGDELENPQNKPCEIDADCDNPCGGKCIEGKCRSVCARSQKCVRDYDTTKYMCCDVENILNGFCCLNLSDGKCCRKWGDSNKMFCCPPDKPLVDGWGTKCLSCDDPQAGVVYLENARCTAVCPNRVQRGPYCLLEDCPSEKPLADWMGNCYACDYPGNINMWYGGKCTGICNPETRVASGQWCGLKTD